MSEVAFSGWTRWSEDDAPASQRPPQAESLLATHDSPLDCVFRKTSVFGVEDELPPGPTRTYIAKGKVVGVTWTIDPPPDAAADLFHAPLWAGYSRFPDNQLLGATTLLHDVVHMLNRWMDAFTPTRHRYVTREAWDTAEFAEITYSTSAIVKSLEVGKHRYQLRAPQLVTLVDGKVQLAGLVGEGKTIQDALQDLGFKLHRRYQDLDFKGPHDWSDEEQDQWDAIRELVDVEEFEQRQPRIERVVGTVKRTDERSSVLRIETWDEDVHVGIEDLPAQAVACLVPGKWFEALIQRTGRTLAWLDFQGRQPLASDAWERLVAASDRARD